MKHYEKKMLACEHCTNVSTWLLLALVTELDCSIRSLIVIPGASIEAAIDRIVFLDSLS